jgi:hypothetical protein
MNVNLKKVMILSALIIVMFAVSTIWAQKGDPKLDSPDLSGTWLLDTNSLSSSQRKSVKDYVLTIEQVDSEVKITRRYTENGHSIAFSETLYTDKRKEENFDANGTNSGFGKVTITSKSYWKKRSIIREFIYNKSDARIAYLLDRQVFSLSKDGRVLTITTEYQPNMQPSLVLGSTPVPTRPTPAVAELTFTKK